MTYFSSQTPPEDISYLASGDEAEALIFSSSTAKRTGETVMENQAAGLDVRYEVAFQIGESVSEVQALFTQLEGRILRVWTIVSERNDAVYRKIYAKEKELIGSFEGMEFEFNVIPSIGRDPKEIISDPAARLVFAR
jgi:hypothetical protein